MLKKFLVGIPYLIIGCCNKYRSYLFFENSNWELISLSEKVKENWQKFYFPLEYQSPSCEKYLKGLNGHWKSFSKQSWWLLKIWQIQNIFTSKLDKIWKKTTHEDLLKTNKVLWLRLSRKIIKTTLDSSFKIYSPLHDYD